jgi:CheY-like chemotaxis protein
MRILFLDDMRVRHDSFDLQLQQTGLHAVQAWTGEQAIELLRREGFDAVLLDHDLGEEHYAEHRAGERAPSRLADGTTVADFVAQLPVELRPRVAIIHSWNRYGANRMANVLYCAGVRVLQIPFCDDLVSQALAQGALT